MKVYSQSPPPRYPQEAREKGIEGEVVLLATIDTKGNLIDIKVVKGDPILVKPTLDAVKHWKYRPYLLNGEPVMVDTTIRVGFHI
ncbi:MAG TPA: energy transducer TonB [Candidatus Angelobacter sp.]